MAEGKNFFEFDDFRELLKHLYDESKAKNKNFSYRYFANAAGFASANFLKQVTDGKSKLSEKSIQKFIKGFKLTSEEGQYFRCLVLFDQAKTPSERETNSREIMRFRSRRDLLPLQEAQYHYFSNWYYVSVRELVKLSDFREDPSWIAKTINPPITEDQAAEALSELFRLGLIAKTPEGRVVQTAQNVTTSDAIISAALANCHKELLKIAAESIDRVPREKRDISFVTFPMASQNVEKLKEIIDKCRRDILEVVAHDEPCDVVYQLNFQLFPTAESKKKE